MSKFLIIFLFFSINLSAQYPTYNPMDSSFTFSYKQSVDLAKYKEERNKLQLQINKLHEMGGQTTQIINKLQLRDTLLKLELEKYEEMDRILRDKVILSNDIVNNYKILLLSSQEELRASKKREKIEKFWKNFYKYSYPIAGGIAAILILK